MQSPIRSHVRLVFLFLTVLCLALPVVWRQLHSAPPIRPAPGVPASPSNYGQVPLSFKANHGQAKEPVKFLARGTNATLYLMRTEVALEVQQAENKTATVKMKGPGECEPAEPERIKSSSIRRVVQASFS